MANKDMAESRRKNSAHRKASRAAQKRRQRQKTRRAFLMGLVTGVVLTVLVVFLIHTALNRPDTGDAPLVALPDPSIAAETATPLPEITETPAATEAPVLTAEPAPAEATAVPQSAAEAPADTAASSDGYQVLSGVPNTDRALGLPETAMVDDSYFNNSVFIGDSVTLKLNYFVRETRQSYSTLLGNAQFLTAGSLGSGNALAPVTNESLHPSFQGKKMLLEDAVAAMGAQKVFIMLGMNDIAVYGTEQSAQNMIQLISRIKAKSPNVQIFVQSATPRLKGDYNKLNNNALFDYDLKLYEYCQTMADSGVYFLDIAYIMRDAEGNLPADYCSDPDDQALHFTDIACKAWVQYLYTHALV